MKRRKIGKMMRMSGLCMILICGCAAAVQGEEVHTEDVECVLFMEEAEEYVIEPEGYALDDFGEGEEIQEINPAPENNRDMEAEDLISHDGYPTEDTEIIQKAIDTGTEVTITVNKDIAVDSTIFISAGKTVAIVPAEGERVIMFRGENLCGTFFFVEEGGTLILGCDGIENAQLVLDGGSDAEFSAIQGDGEVRIMDSVEMAGLDAVEEDVVIGDGDFSWPSGDLSEAYIEIFGGENLIYNGNPQTPDVFVWMGTQMLMKGFDYDLAYKNNVNAGVAEIVVTATGIGTCTGTGSTVFMIQPAIPQYEISDQIVECGIGISQLLVSEYAVGVLGEPVDGEVMWAASEGGSALPEDMLLSGATGDTMELYWTFYPEESNYAPVSGNITISFVMPEIPGNGNLGDEDMWGNLGDDVGNLSGGSSSSGVTGGEDFSVDFSTEPDTEPEETESPETESSETDVPETEAPESEIPKKEETEKNVVKNPAAGTTSNAGAQPGISVNHTKTAGSSVSVSGGVSVNRSNPATGDECKAEHWMMLGAAALLTGIFMLDMKVRILYNGKR